MKKKLFLITVLSMLLFSCGNDTDAPEPNGKTGKGIRFSSSVDGGMLKATSSWKAGDEIFVYMMAANNQSSTYSDWFKYNQTPVTYVTLNGDGMFAPKTPADELFFPENGDSVNFVAYAPYAPFEEHPRPLNSSPLYLPMRDGVPTVGYIHAVTLYQEDQSKLDVIIAKDLTSRTKDESNIVQLEFEHTMSKLEFNISVEGDLTENDLTGLKVYSYRLDYLGQNFLGRNYPPDSYEETGGWRISRGENKYIYFKVSPNGKFSEVTLLPEGHFINPRDLTVTFELTNGEKYEWDYNTQILLKGVKRKYNIVLRKKNNQKTALQLGESIVTDWVGMPIENVVLE